MLVNCRGCHCLLGPLIFWLDNSAKLLTLWPFLPFLSFIFVVASTFFFLGNATRVLISPYVLFALVLVVVIKFLHLLSVLLIIQNHVHLDAYFEILLMV